LQATHLQRYLRNSEEYVCHVLVLNIPAQH
jgi:hypothetical protein